MTSLPMSSDRDKIETALRKARKYIKTVESCRKEGFGVLATRRMIDRFADGDEVEAIDDALAELGIIT